MVPSPALYDAVGAEGEGVAPNPTSGDSHEGALRCVRLALIVQSPRLDRAVLAQAKRVAITIRDLSEWSGAALGGLIAILIVCKIVSIIISILARV